jgi:MFS family permease
MGTTRLLIATRFIRSIGQGAMIVDFSLYLKALGWSAVEISLVLSLTLAVGVVLTLLAGPLSDRRGRRVFLLGYEVAQAVAGVAAFLTARPAVLVMAAVVGGFGRGGNGAAGPFAPVEQAWLAQSVSAARRGPVYSAYAALGFFGMAMGAGMAVLPSRLQTVLPGALAYRPLFLIIVLTSLTCCGLLWLASDTEAGPRPRLRAQETEVADQIQKRENTLVRRLMIANLLNGIGIGATGPLILIGSRCGSARGRARSARYWRVGSRWPGWRLSSPDGLRDGSGSCARWWRCGWRGWRR